MKKQNDLYPCFDRLQELIDQGATIEKQGNGYFIFDSDGEALFSGDTIRDLMIYMILSIR
jgi:hypothetical protein